MSTQENNNISELENKNSVLYKDGDKEYKIQAVIDSSYRNKVALIRKVIKLDDFIVISIDNYIDKFKDDPQKLLELLMK